MQEQLRPDLRHHGWAFVDSSLRQVDALGTQGDECQGDKKLEELVGREDKRIGPQEREAERAGNGARHGSG